MNGMFEDIKEVVIEGLAKTMHKVWSHWMSYLFRTCEAQADGSYLIPREYARRWMRQIETPYVSLSEKEQESDRDVVRMFFIK